MSDRNNRQAQYYNRSAWPPLPRLHEGQHIACVSHVPRHGSQEQSKAGQTCAPRSYTFKSSTTGTVYSITRCQLKPDNASSDHASTRGQPVNHPMPSDQEGVQPGQPVELANESWDPQSPSLWKACVFWDLFHIGLCNITYGYITNSQSDQIYVGLVLIPFFSGVNYTYFLANRHRTCWWTDLCSTRGTWNLKLETRGWNCHAAKLLISKGGSNYRMTNCAVEGVLMGILPWLNTVALLFGSLFVSHFFFSK